MAGSKTPQGQQVATLERAIREAGRIPIQRNTYYEPLQPTPDMKPLPDTSGPNSEALV